LFLSIIRLSEILFDDKILPLKKKIKFRVLFCFSNFARKTKLLKSDSSVCFDFVWGIKQSNKLFFRRIKEKTVQHNFSTQKIRIFKKPKHKHVGGGVVVGANQRQLFPVGSSLCRRPFSRFRGQIIIETRRYGPYIYNYI
jgi:hypothetical protein